MMGRRFGFGQQMPEQAMNPTQQMPQQRNGVPFQGGGSFMPPGQMMRPQITPPPGQMEPEAMDPTQAPPGLLAAAMQKPMQASMPMQDRRLPAMMGGMRGQMPQQLAGLMDRMRGQMPQSGLKAQMMRRRFGFGGMR